MTKTQHMTKQGDCLEILKSMKPDSVDLVFCSPPYEAARTYGIDFKLKGQAWVDWAFERYFECVRISRGLVAWVVEGQTRQFRYSATPALLMADLHRAGVKLRKPPIFKRVGIPGSGGPDWWRNDWEWIVCSSKGKLPWSDNTAMGHPPKWAPGGAMSNRTEDGRRKNARDSNYIKKIRISRSKLNSDRGGGVSQEGFYEWSYKQPEKANPGNVISCIVGGGTIGSKLAHENEAPFPEKLAEAFILTFCPPEGIVVDPFCGSGTTLAVAKKNNRSAIGFDIRQNQIELTNRRLDEVEVPVNV